jgi:GT2 family glycosyltransferase
MFDIAAILINYNSNILTQKCIHSIINNSSLTNFQIIVVDNASEKEDFILLEQFCENISFKNLQLIRNKVNTGFGSGNMTGFHFANAKYVAFINNDTLFLNDCFYILKKALEKDSSIGMVGGQSYKESGKRMIAFGHFASPYKEIFGQDLIEKVNPKKYHRRKAEYNNPIKVNYVQGSFMMMRTEDFKETGGFDTNIFLYYEETDMCLRLKKQNKSCYLIPEAKYVHFHGASTPRNIAIKTELKISLLYVIRKHYGLFWHQIILNKMRIQYLFKSIFKPNYWYLFKVLLAGAPLSKSLRISQKIK